jgi:uncharacterized protein YbbK (DUF523 family)
VPGGKIGESGVSESDIINFLEERIEDKEIEGFVDTEKKQFTHMSSHRQTLEVVQYNIATSFDLSEGMLRIKCPSCGSPNIQKVKANESKCANCGTYVVPKKILDML